MPQRGMLALVLEQLPYAFGEISRVRKADDDTTAFSGGVDMIVQIPEESRVVHV
ncbi:hypothetical protein J53TS2_44980 [Paenibacillus sp. J53TS2]|nr:hypothetical protein J53TS2_44980 [Paenibacillus sp. J53TS2]